MWDVSMSYIHHQCQRQTETAVTYVALHAALQRQVYSTQVDLQQSELMSEQTVCHIVRQELSYSLVRMQLKKTFLFEDFIPHCRRPFIPYCSIANRFYIVLNSCCSRLKGHSTKFTHYSLFIGVGEYYCICEKSQIKHFVASEEADKLPPVISLNA